MDKQKRQHTIQREYLSGWDKGNGIYRFDKNGLTLGAPASESSISIRKKIYSIKIQDGLVLNSIFGGKDCFASVEDIEDEDLHIIFNNLDIVYDNKNLISNIVYLSSCFDEYDSWCIKENGENVSKAKRNEIKNKLNHWHCVVVEESFKYVEDKWKITKQYLNDLIHKKEIDPEIKKSIIEYYIIQKERIVKNDIKKVYTVISQIIENNNDYGRQMWLSALYKIIQDFKLGEETNGEYYAMLETLMLKNIFLFIAPKGYEFIISDKPVSKVINERGHFSIMPLSPEVLFGFSETSNIKVISEEETKYYNRCILRNCDKYVYSSRNDITTLLM